MTDDTRLREELGRRARSAPDAHLTFEEVRRTARRIRRRRRAAVAVAVAAAVGVVAVVPLVLSGGSSRGHQHPSPARPVEPQRPGASVLHDGTLTRPDGTTVRIDVDNADVSQLAVLSDGRIVLAMQRPYGVRVYAPDGSLLQRQKVQANVLTASADDTAVAWVGEDFGTRILTAGVGEARAMAGVPMPGESPGSIDAVLGPARLLVGDFTTTTGEVTPDGYAERGIIAPLRVTDVSPDGRLWAVQYPDDADPQVGCAGVYDPEQDQLVAHSCDTAGLRFAPDGRHLLGMVGDNNMAGEVTTFDLRLAAVGTFRPASGKVVSRAAWSDPTHLAVSVASLDGSQWSLVRVGVDGTDPVEVAGPTDGRSPETTAEFLLSE